MKNFILLLLCSFVTLSVSAQADQGRHPPRPVHHGHGHGGGGGWHNGNGGWDNGNGGWDNGNGGWDNGNGGWDHGGNGGWDHGGNGGYPGRQQYVQCSSFHYAYSQCPVNGQIRSARLVRQDSSSSCAEGRDWGYQQNSIWVDGGCRGVFLVDLY